jgi:hypothetical protein
MLSEQASDSPGAWKKTTPQQEQPMTQPASDSTEKIKSVLEEQSLEKWAPSLSNKQELYDALDKAFDYRGDITITLRDGKKIVAYVFNREPKAPEPFIEVYPADQDQKVKIHYKDVAGLAFTGIDTAAGKSWAVWMEKQKAKEGNS